mmetsp:Transcript_24969/g.4136  ORF Transcript_24969/g.4136 Transcript_24969/m.4136 type:complete len:82 (-) Transcript_24969:634-879(-)
MYSMQPLSPQFGYMSGNNYWHNFSGTPISDLKITPSPFDKNDIFVYNSSFGNNFVSPFRTISPGPSKKPKMTDDFNISTFE